MGRFVIAVYRPLPGKEEDLLRELEEHLPTLRSQGLVTDRPPYTMRAADGTFVEVFEWRSDEAIEEAHRNETVKAMWERFERACTYETLTGLEEAAELFATFDAVDIPDG